MHRKQRQLNFHRAPCIARQGGHAQFMHQPRRNIGGHADIALAATQHQRNCAAIVTGIDAKFTRHLTNQPLSPLNVASRFLDAHNARHLGQPHHGFMGHVRDRTARYVVQHHRQVNRFGDCLEVLVLAFLRRLVVIGHDLQLTIGAHAFGEPGQLNRLGRRVCTAARHHGDAAASLLHRDADDFAMLFNVDGG